MVARRIEWIATDIRGYSRKIEGSSHNFGGGYIETTAPATGAYRERLLTQRAQLEDQRNYWLDVREAQAAAGEVTIHSRETIAKGDMIKHRFGWHVVTRVNPKSVTVGLDWNDGTRPYEVAYADVQGHHTAAEVEAARAAAEEKATTTTEAVTTCGRAMPAASEVCDIVLARLCRIFYLFAGGLISLVGGSVSSERYAAPPFLFNGKGKN